MAGAFRESTPGVHATCLQPRCISEVFCQCSQLFLLCLCRGFTTPMNGTVNVVDGRAIILRTQDSLHRDYGMRPTVGCTCFGLSGNVERSSFYRINLGLPSGPSQLLSGMVVDTSLAAAEAPIASRNIPDIDPTMLLAVQKDSTDMGVFKNQGPASGGLVKGIIAY